MSVRSVSASARCECEVMEETTEEKEEEGVGAQNQKQETRGKVIGPGNPARAIQLKDVGRPTTKGQGSSGWSSVRAQESNSGVSVRWEGEPRKTESCVRTKCDAT